ncbi:CAZyme family AA3 [Trichoderma aggressivum f. europaeum]|uniref:Cholesterol oxidase n=1 Tax=Trichoderma aggressivum f. europaeum TaxID=173218 RepID=A0AAE1LZK8_9HYPO|nr:CAZyme family AA3 [Trichoderma aggressivum f. europaeum]
MAKSCPDAFAHKMQKPTHNQAPAPTLTLQHQPPDQQNRYIDDLGAPPVKVYGDYHPIRMADEYFFDKYMYPTPPLTASLVSEDDDVSSSSGLSAYSEPIFAPDGIPTDPFPRISKPVELLRHSYDCVVIGSGYGGSIAASRMARAGQSVCLLERGEERWPGEYPTATMETFKQLRLTGDITSRTLGKVPVNSGNPTGMFNLFFGRDQSVVLGNGLGGSSLINANVFLEADEQVLTTGFWPPEIRKDPAHLEKYYQKVRDVLEPEPYPDDWPALKKTEILEKQARVLGLADKFRKVPLTTRFRSGPNSSGVNMSASTLSGQDSTGVNDGSKTTTLVTYLADAWNWGAEMFCKCEVRYIERVQDERGGYLIYFAWHGRGRERFSAEHTYGDLMWVHAKKAVFLGAGSIGTTEILLRSKQMGLGMSDWVGRGMSGNGDVLAFGHNCKQEVNALGKASPDPANPVGPTITSAIDNRAGLANPLDGYIIQEGTMPNAFSQLLQCVLDLMPGSHSPDKSLFERTREAMGVWKSRLLGPLSKKGTLGNTQVFLIMSHDGKEFFYIRGLEQQVQSSLTNSGSQATLSLKNDRPVLEFQGVGKSDRIKRFHDILEKATDAVGGTLVYTPMYHFMNKHQITAHPLGGAPMSRDNTAANGATNHLGQLFAGNDTSEIHPGLIVADGAIIPASIGVNPLATIAALAERTVESYARANGLTIDETKNDVLDLYGEPAHKPRRDGRSCESTYRSGDETPDQMSNKAKLLRQKSVEFTELMSGFLHKTCSSAAVDDTSAYESDFRAGKGRGEVGRLLVSATVFDGDILRDESQPSGMLTGTFVCPTIEGSPFMLSRGDLGLFKRNHKAPGSSILTYDCDMAGANGRRLRLHGYKLVDASVSLSPLQMWRSTTTLYVSITERGIRNEDANQEQIVWHDDVADFYYQDVPLSPSEKLVARGILNLRPKDFVSEMMTLSPSGSSFLNKAINMSKFMSFFTSKSLSHFLTPLGSLEYPEQGFVSYINYTPPSQTYVIVASDGIETELHMWEPNPSAVATDSRGSPVKVENLFMIPGASVDHQIFALPTISFNSVNYFTRAGYRVFVTVHRICQLNSLRKQEWTTYDSRFDIRACLQQIRRVYGVNKIYTVAHCMGSVALAGGLLDGTIPPEWILGITCSQVFMNPIWSTMNMIKARSPVQLDKMYESLLGNWLDCSTSNEDSLAQRTVNQLLRFWPEKRGEVCRNAACHRTTLLFGRCWSHRNLNEETHRNMDRFFGGSSMTLMNLLKRMGSRGYVSSNAPEYEEFKEQHHIERLRGIPIMLFVGEDSDVLSPRATETSYERLIDSFGISAGLPGGGVQYRRRLVQGYGHLDCWMGRNAWRDVYPFVREEIDRVVRGESYRFHQPNDRFKCFAEDTESHY